MNVLTSLEAKDTPLACTVYNTLEDLCSYLKSGTTKSTFGQETDRLMSKLTQAEKKKMIKSFQGVFKLAHKKLKEHLDHHPAYGFYQAARIFDPRQLSIVGHDIDDFSDMKALRNPSQELMEEWLIYTQLRQDSLYAALELPSFWKSMEGRFLLLSKIASEAIWMPVTSVEVEHSFSQYKHILNERRESLTDENTRRLVMLYYNGDIEHRF